MHKFLTAVLLTLISLPIAQGQSTTSTDFMRNTGSIWVVVGVILITLIGLFTILIRLGSRLTKLENHLKQKENVR
jgi:ABC-type nickel/cobalt efflux system permease component RcnA